VVVIAVLAGVLIWSATSHETGQICAGQCGPPWHFVVVFNKGVSPAELNSAVKRCEHSPAFISASTPMRRMDSYEDRYVVGVETRTIQDTSQTRQLLDCLHQSSAVEGVGFPD